MGAHLDADIGIVVGLDHLVEGFEEAVHVLVVVLVGADQLVGQLGGFCRLHFLIIVVEKIDLQEPDQGDQKQGEADEIDPQLEPDAVEVESSLQIQICSPPL